MNIRYKGGIDLLGGVGWLPIRNLRENDTFGNQQGTRTLPGLDVDDLVPDYLPRHLVCRLLLEKNKPPIPTIRSANQEEHHLPLPPLVAGDAAERSRTTAAAWL